MQADLFHPTTARVTHRAAGDVGPEAYSTLRIRDDAGNELVAYIDNAAAARSLLACVQAVVKHLSPVVEPGEAAAECGCYDPDVQHKSRGGE